MPTFFKFCKGARYSEAISDPYYGVDDGFEEVLNMIKVASQNLLQEFRFISRWILI